MAKRAATTDEETARLKEMVERQLQRLLCQLKDLDELKDELTEDEIRETRSETMAELNEFRDNLDRMIAGDMTLMDELGAVRMATMAAINEAFKTPEIIRLFGARETEQLRASLTKLQENRHLGKITVAAYEEGAMEILTALRSLNEPLSDEEAAFLSQQMQQRFSGFQESSNGVNKAPQGSLVSKFGDVCGGSSEREACDQNFASWNAFVIIHGRMRRPRAQVGSARPRLRRGGRFFQCARSGSAIAPSAPGDAAAGWETIALQCPQPEPSSRGLRRC